MRVHLTAYYLLVYMSICLFESLSVNRSVSLSVCLFGQPIAGPLTVKKGKARIVFSLPVSLPAPPHHTSPLSFPFPSSFPLPPSPTFFMHFNLLCNWGKHGRGGGGRERTKKSKRFSKEISKCVPLSIKHVHHVSRPKRKICV